MCKECVKGYVENVTDGDVFKAVSVTEEGAVNFAFSVCPVFGCGAKMDAQIIEESFPKDEWKFY